MTEAAQRRSLRIRNGELRGVSGMRPVGEVVNSAEMDALDEAEPKLSGQAVLDLRWAFEQRLGAELVTRALARVRPSARELYERATPLTWVPYSVTRAVHAALARESDRTVESILEDVVPLAVERSLTTAWRLLLRFTSDDALVTRIPLFYARTRSRGTLTRKHLATGTATLELGGWASVPAEDLSAIAASIATFLRLGGRVRATVRVERAASGALFHATWAA